MDFGFATVTEVCKYLHVYTTYIYIFVDVGTAYSNFIFHSFFVTTPFHTFQILKEKIDFKSL